MTDVASKLLGEPDTYHQSFWGLLTDGNFAAAKNMCPPDFDWKSLDAQTGLTVLHTLLEPLILKDDRQAVIDLASWMISQGADPTLLAPAACEHEFHFTPTAVRRHADEDTEEKDKHIKVDAGGKSAITCIIDCREEMHDIDADEWEEEMEWLGKFMTALTQQVPQRGLADKTPIDDGVISMWEKMRKMTESHDVKFEACDGFVGANACVLSASSPVLAAMLSSEMTEGRERRISVKESSCRCVNLLLDLAYTGGTCLEIDCDGALATLDLAHRWQIHSVVAMLQRTLKSMISDRSFSSIAEAALLKGLPELIESCKKFGTTSTWVQKEIKAGRLPMAVAELMGIFQQRSAKKRRTL